MTKLSSGDKSNPDNSLERLLDLDGEIMEMGEGFWVKIEARKVPPSEGKPHGVDYSLCLFSQDDRRLVCFDNAHSVPVGSGPSRKQSKTNDHLHQGTRIKPYDYTDAETLLVDFWNEVEKTLKAEGIS